MDVTKSDRLSDRAKMLLEAWVSTVAPDVGGRYGPNVGCVGIKYDKTKIDFVDDISALEEILQFAGRMSERSVKETEKS